jgi:hypothetical protein
MKKSSIQRYSKRGTPIITPVEVDGANNVEVRICGNITEFMELLKMGEEVE